MPKFSFNCGSGSASGFNSLNNRLGWMSRLCWYFSLAYSVIAPVISW